MASNAAHPSKEGVASRWQSFRIVIAARRLIDRLVGAQIVINSLVLAAQAFLALFPLLILVYSIIPPGAASGLVDALRHRLGVSGQSEQVMRELVGDRNTLRQGLSFVSAVLVFGSATAFTRALQRVYEGAWGLSKLGLRGAWRWFAWLGMLGFYLLLVGAVVHFIRVGEINYVVQTALGFVFWWWTPFLLLGGRVCWRALMPGAALTTVAQIVVTISSAIVMPRLMRSNEADYGPIGSIFALESWLVILAGVLVVGAALGAWIGQSEGRLGSSMRGNDRPDGWLRRGQTESG